MKTWIEKREDDRLKKELELKNELQGCIIRYRVKQDAIKLINEIKESFICTGKDSYKNWLKWQKIETELKEL